MAQATRVPGLGARTGTATAGKKLLHARFADVESQVLHAAQRCEPEPIHDLRVACRRLRAAIKLFGRKELRRQDGRVERLQDTLGELRDAQLTVAWLERNEAGELARDQRAKLETAAESLRKTLALWSARSAPAVLRALPAVRRRGKLGGDRMRRRLRKRLRAVEEAMAPARTIDPRAVHALRIAGKKLRYEAELLERAFDLDDLLDVAKELQDVFGELHDADLRLDLVSGDERLRAIARRERERRCNDAVELLARFDRDAVLPNLRRSLK